METVARADKGGRENPITMASSLRANKMKSNPRPYLNPTTETLVVFLLLILPQIAKAADYLNSGTIIVIAQTKDRVIMAADSRSGATTDGITVNSVDDSMCKIAAFGHNVAFSAAGILGGPGQEWTAISLAVEIVRASAPRLIGSRQGEAILDKWADSMIQRLHAFSSEQLLSYATANGGHITTGVLAGIEKDKKTWVRAVMVKFSSMNGLTYQGYTLTSDDPPSAYYFLGKSQIGSEFEKDKSSGRAIEERASWDHKNLNGAALDRFKARRLVELTIMYHSNKNDVGGAVDEIEVDESGVRWLHLKPNCTQIYP
jgi:hypothetical protein